MKKKVKWSADWIYILLLLVVPVMIYVLSVSGGTVFGSNLDWISQHSALPDYFRKLFYETGSIFPQFAKELGGGQNIFNFAYYGLYNPFYLLSYLFPFVKMQNYIQALSVLEMMADGVLCFIWLKKRFAKKYSFIASLMLILSFPVLYHSATQLMFVNYMPFLLGTFIGYDRYKRTNHYGVLTCSVLGMIVTSFYFAVGGLVVLFFYGLTELTKKEVLSFTDFIKVMWHRFYPVLLGCFLSVFYLLPVYFAMSAGRGSETTLTLKDLLVPQYSCYKFVYGEYGLGVTAIAMVALFTFFFYHNSHEKRLAIVVGILFFFPVFCWLLNGGLYIRDKALIPFLPVMAYLFSSYLEKLCSHQFSYLQVLTGVISSFSFLLFFSHDTASTSREYLLLDFLLCIIGIFISLKIYKNAILMFSAAIMLTFGVIQVFETSIEMVPNALHQEFSNQDVNRAIQKLLEKEDSSNYRIETRGNKEYNKGNYNRPFFIGQNLTTSYSSISNQNYIDFRKSIGLSKSTRNTIMEDVMCNPLFLRFMGVKNIVATKEFARYPLCDQQGDVSIYENSNVAPIAYLTDQFMSEQQFDSLFWGQKQLALVSYAVTDNNGAKVPVPNLQRYGLKVTDFSNEYVTQTYENGSLKCEGKTACTRKIALEKPVKKDGYLFLSFRMDNHIASQDANVVVDGEKNKMSRADNLYQNGNDVFHYTIPVKKGTETISILFGKGNYTLSEICVEFGCEDMKKSATLYQDDAVIQKNKTDNEIVMNCTALKDEMLITSIPYDENFEIYVDDEKTAIQKVNTAFLGCSMPKGRHHVRIVYHAKGRNAGLFVTGITILIMLADQFRKKRYRRE